MQQAATITKPALGSSTYPKPVEGKKNLLTPRRRVYCLTCEKTVKALLVTGKDVEPDKKAMSNNYFYQCGTCKCYVGCHKNANNKTEPLGAIPSELVRQARWRVYNGFCIVAKNLDCKTSVVYKKVAENMGKRITIANIRSIEEALEVLMALDLISKEKQE